MSGHVGRAPGRPPRRLDVQRAVIPAADGVDEAEFLRALFLAEQVHLMAEIHQGPGQFRVIDVTSGAAQEVSMENKNAHERHSPP